MIKPDVRAFFDAATWTLTYVVKDPDSAHCAIIDSVLDYDAASGRTRTESADRVIAMIQADDLIVDWILETHVHADHLSAAPYLHRALGGQIGIGNHIVDVQTIFAALFNVEPEFKRDGSQFDALFDDNETFQIGGMTATAMHTPGHTPACMSYLIGDALFVGDTLFMPDYGTARCDFPGGDARTLYQSIQRLLALPPETRMFLCHDYLPNGRELTYQTTVEAQRRSNIHVHSGISEEEFVTMRTAKDQTLSMPTLILPSVQINMRAGQLPPAEANGTRYLKIPLDAV
ncbi:MAG: MBL fold metallo-hydrolase [Litorivicinaceae bacterium]|jgi:glyoxylase-like metal-dependent hydrolase (beta-lactamase superfamily II)|nr:MBL fold metallo-hydrolase [Litorivicinaceae bacterium]MDP5328978.1 MBL fold metallo-hydrolase [Litorivicinaceae bacterium]MDP5330754.1 MBL fold metallo-hydrolase [Litorivicinaceae bacterium]MDP5340518.1 MBL fold metallo-hydrolase [Litorivicinaceae bacterium]MDP5342277.1 MBL fold metallo-hydrolase [Litorivicinaceae bacterium]